MNDVLMKGRCPMCREQLHFNGTHLYCPNGDYKVDPIAYDELWDGYIKSNHTAEEAEQLLLSLEALHGQPIPERPDRFSRPECLFVACPCPSLCKFECQHMNPRAKFVIKSLDGAKFLDSANQWTKFADEAREFSSYAEAYHHLFSSDCADAIVTVLIDVIP